MKPLAPLVGVLISVTVLALAGGCVNEPAALPGGAVDNPLAVQADYQTLFDAAAAVLRDHRFVIFRLDPSIGEISTEPMTGQQAWEYWRSDAAGDYNKLESSLHTILRTASVRIFPVRDAAGNAVAGTFYIEVRVSTDRLSVPEREFTAANELPNSYVSGRGMADALTMDQQNIAETHPVYLGRDSRLEDWLLRDVLRKLGGRTASPPPASQPDRP